MAITNVADNYLFGKGKIGVFERDSNGNTTKGLYLGNCPELKISLTTEKIQHYESYSGQNLQDREIIKSIGAELSLVTENLSADNLGLLVWGAKSTIAAATNQTYAFPTVEANGLYRIPDGFNLTDLVITDGAGSPATLVEGTDYEVDEDFGTVKFLAGISNNTQPFTAEFDRGGATNVPFFGTSRPNRFLQFEGINIGNPSQTKVRVEIYNCVFDPVADLSLIGDDFGKFELKGAALRDSTREANSALKGFGRIIYL